MQFDESNSTAAAAKADTNDIKPQISTDCVPQTLLIELSSLSTLKYKIGLKSKSFSLNLPVNSVDKESVLLSQSSDSSSDEHNKYASDYILLNCRINNVKLPLVPPIKVLVPYDYPNSNAFVECVQLEEFDEDMLPEYSKYYSTLSLSLLILKIFFKGKLGILRKINKIFQKNYSCLGDRHSVTQLLDAWVRNYLIKTVFIIFFFLVFKC